MKSYCVIINFPEMENDSVLIFEQDDFVCSYRMEASSHALVELLWLIEKSGYFQISSQTAVDWLNKAKAEELYNNTKKLADKFLVDSRRDEVQTAYRASRNYFFQTIRDLNLPDSCGEILNERSIRMEEAKAIFAVVRRVFETEIRPISEDFEGLHRMFDGAPEEIILALKDYECLKGIE